MHSLLFPHPFRVWFLFEINLKIIILEINQKRIMMRIRIIQPVSDVNDHTLIYEVGTELNLGVERNKAAVNKRVAVWIDNGSNEKVSIPTDKKKKVSKAGSNIIETKKD